MGGMGGFGNKIAGGDSGSAMNILMPMYTVGILLFFVYTMMKVPISLFYVIFIQ